MSAAMHSLRSARNQEGLEGLAFGPLSPPVITQSREFAHSPSTTEPSKGSAEMKRTLAGKAASSGRRLSAHSWFSVVVPIHTLLGHSSPHGTKDDTRSGRLVSNNQSSAGVASMSFQSLARSTSRSRRSSKTSAIDAQKTRALMPSRSACRFQASGSDQCRSLKKRRSASMPQTCSPRRFDQLSA